MYKGNVESSVKAGHYFYFQAFQADGLAVCSSGDWATMSGIYNSSDATIFDYAGSMSYEKPLVGGGTTTVTFTSSEISDLVDYVENTTYKTRTNDTNSSGDEKTIRQIQASKYGCLYNGLGTSSAKKLYFMKKHEENISRVPSLHSDTLITATPRRKSGAKYAFKQSLSEDTGVYIGDVHVSKDNYAACVSAPLKLIYNHNQGLWECSSSFLCVLIEDIDAADIISPDLSVDNLEGKTSSEFYGAGATNSMNNFTTGLAVALTVHDNNPYSFGPSLVKYDGSTRVEKIRVVNRTPQLFNKGEIALVEQVDGENILIKISGDGTVQERPPKFKGPWLFTKFYTSSDEYYRFTNGDRITYGQEVIDFTYDKLFRTNETKNLSDYHQDVIMNQIASGDGLRGTATHTAFGDRININVGVGNNDQIGALSVLAEDIYMFWGPMFPNGMNAGGGGRDKFQLPAEAACLGPFKDESGEYDGSPVEYAAATLTAINNGSLSDLKARLGGSQYSLASGLNLKPAISNTIQFSLMSADLYGHLDEASTQTNLTYGNEKEVRNFYKTSKSFSGAPLTTNWFGGKHTNQITGTIQGAWSHIYDSAPTSTGPKYDAYVTKEPQDKPQGAWEIFGDASYGDWDYRGANAVGLICARRLVEKNGEWTLNVDTEQTFGMRGRFFGGATGAYISANVTSLFAGGGISFSSNSFVSEPIQGVTTVWGSTLDRIDSFGTAALHVQVWDGWPREDTLWLPQYASVLHFTPTGSSTTKTYTVDSWNETDEEWEEVEIEVDQIDSIVDFKVPTYGHEIDGKQVYNTAPDGQTVGLGVISGALRPQEYWNVDKSARRRYVTYYGYQYNRTVIGVGGTGSIITAGSGFQEDEFVDLGRGVKIKVTSVDADGGITGFSLLGSGETEPSQTVTIPDRIDGTSEHSFLFRGEGFEPKEFPVTLNVPSVTGGEAAEIQWPSAFGWDKPDWIAGPKPQSELVRCSLASGSGQNATYGGRSVQIGVSANDNNPAAYKNSLYPGEYEIFAYCHNDVGIFLHKSPHATSPYMYHQYITATFS